MDRPQNASCLVRFGAYEVDPLAREVRKHGHRVPVRGHCFDLLLALLEHPGCPVTRDELRRRLWPGGIFVEFDNSLNSAVTRLRAALNDSAGRHRYVETLPGVGYRFVGHLRSPSRAVVIAQFLNLTGDPSHEGVCRGIQEELLAQLHGSEHLAVLLARGREPCLRIGGSVRARKDLLRVSAHLVEVPGERCLWSAGFEGNPAEPVELQQRLAFELVAAVIAHMPDAE